MSQRGGGMPSQWLTVVALLLFLAFMLSIGPRGPVR